MLQVQGEDSIDGMIWVCAPDVPGAAGDCPPLFRIRCLPFFLDNLPMKVLVFWEGQERIEKKGCFPGGHKGPRAKGHTGEQPLHIGYDLFI